MPPRAHRVATATGRSRQSTSCSRYLRDWRTRLGGFLSGGEQQMLTIARTLMGNELRVFVPRSRRKSSVGRRGRGALLGAGRIWKFQAGGSDVEAGGAGEMV